jgi:ATP-dependent Clp protease adaptor protein ClpS
MPSGPADRMEGVGTGIPQVVPETVEKVRLAPRYHVVLLDDDDHTYEYVIEMLGKIFGYGVEKAYGMAKEVDSTGRVIVFTGGLERAEVKRDAIHGYGADRRIPRCKGSMSAILEPADDA